MGVATLQTIGWAARPVILGCAGLLCLVCGAARADESAATKQPPCEIAVVNPVSNFAECVKPRGAHVDSPPKRATPTAEECRRHAQLDVEECRGYESPQQSPQQPPPR